MCIAERIDRHTEKQAAKYRKLKERADQELEKGERESR